MNPKTGSSCALKITIHPLHHKKAWKISPLDGHWTGEVEGRIQSEAPPGEGIHTPSGFYLQEPAQTRPRVNQVKAWTELTPGSRVHQPSPTQHNRPQPGTYLVIEGGSKWLENARTSILGGAWFKKIPTDPDLARGRPDGGGTNTS